MNARRIVLSATLILGLLFGLPVFSATTGSAYAGSETPVPITPLPMVTYEPGAQIKAQGPAETVTILPGEWLHFNLSCDGCSRGQEINFLTYVTVSGTVTIDGTIWTYGQRMPTHLDELCDPNRDFWPSEWPNNWPKFGALTYPCGVSTGSWSLTTPVPQLTPTPSMID